MIIRLSRLDGSDPLQIAMVLEKSVWYIAEC